MENKNVSFIPNYDRFLNVRKDLVNDPQDFPDVKDDYFTLKKSDE